MSKHGTASNVSVSGSFIEFVSAVIRNLPRDLEPQMMDGWANNGESLAKVLRTALCPSEEGSVPKPEPEATHRPILRLISEGKVVSIPARNEQRTLARAKQTFLYIDPDFQNWDLDRPREATPETAMAVYELVRDTTFQEMFGSLATGGNLNKLTLTQDQIEQFVQSHSDWLRTGGYATFFLFKMDSRFFVASVYVCSDGYRPVRVHRLGHDYVWCGRCRPRLVVPQLEK